MPACTTGANGQLIPQLADFTVNQGVPTYATSRLVRAKDTLVKLYLTLPTGCSGSISIKPTSALSFSAGAAVTLPPYGQSSNGGLSSAPQVNSNADPLFFVPAGSLAPGDGATTFDVTFTANVRFAQNRDSTVFTRTFTKTVTFEKKTNALRILVIPMGDASQSYATQFPAIAQTDVQNAMSTLSRIFPVEDGVGSLGSSTGGIRYTIDLATLLDVRSIAGAYSGSPAKFCLSQAVFEPIRAQLAALRQSWNTMNPAATADVVVGVFHQSISNGGSAGCAEGMGSVTSPEAIVRAIDDQPKARPPVVSMTGSLMAMEIFHTFGGRFGSASFHSPNVAADGTAPGKAYNTSSKLQLANNHSVMRLDTSTGPWNNSTTLLEPQDFADLRCFLTQSGLTTTSCTVGGVVGTSTGVAAGPHLVGDGTTNGTSGGTTLEHIYYSTDVADGGICPSSTIRLVQIAGSTQLNQGVCLSAQSSEHDEDAGGHVNTGVGQFAFSTDALANADEWRLVNSVTNEVLASATRITPPQVTGIAFNKPVPTSFNAPTIPPKPAIVFLADTTGSMGAAIADVKANITGENGIIERVRAERPNARFGAAQYKDVGDSVPYQLDHAITDNADAVVTALNTNWGASGGGDTPEAQLNALYQLATGSGVGFQSAETKIIAWFGDAPGHDPSNGHSLSDVIGALNAATIRVVAISVNGNGLDSTGQATSITNATGGSFQTGVSADAVADAILSGLQNLPVTLTHTTDCNQAGLTLTMGPQQPPNPVASGAAVEYPEASIFVAATTPAGTYECTATFAVNGTPDPSLTQTYEVAVPADNPPDVTITATSTVPGRLCADAYYLFEGLFYPVDTCVPPTETTSTTATFDVRSFDLSNAPGTTGQLVVCVLDQFSRTCTNHEPTTVPGGSTVKGPTAAVYEPTERFMFVTGSTLPCEGTGYDAEGRALPPSALDWTLAPSGGGPTVKSANDTASCALLLDIPIGEYTLTLTATDPNGASATDTREIDVVAAPTVSATHPGGPVSTAASVVETVAASAGAGLASVACTLDESAISLPAPSGTPDAAYEATFGVPGLGLHTVRCTATDTAGFTAEAIDQIHLVYGFTGFFAPIKNGAVNTGKAGRTYALKWQLTDAAGALVTSTAVVRSINFVPLSCATMAPAAGAQPTKPAGGSTLRYDAAASQFVFNWKTPSTKGCYQLQLTLDDDSVHSASFKLT